MHILSPNGHILAATLMVSIFGPEHKLYISKETVGDELLFRFLKGLIHVADEHRALKEDSQNGSHNDTFDPNLEISPVVVSSLHLGNPDELPMQKPKNEETLEENDKVSITLDQIGVHSLCHLTLSFDH